MEIDGIEKFMSYAELRKMLRLDAQLPRPARYSCLEFRNRKLGAKMITRSFAFLPEIDEWIY